MVSIKGNLKPFRITKEDMVELLTQLTKKLSSVERIQLEVERFSFESVAVQEVKEFLGDIHLRPVANDISTHIYGSPMIYLSFSKFDANYTITDASDIDEARQIEDFVLSFFDRHKTFRFFSLFPGMFIGLILLIIGLFALEPLIDFLMGRITLAYPFLYAFFSIACFTFSIYIFWTIATHETPSFSFVHSVLFLREEKRNVMWALIFAIILEITVAIAVTLITQ